MRVPTPMLVAALLAGTAVSGSAQAESPDPYEQLAALAGEWEADLAGFGKLTNTIRLVSNGTAVEETIGTPADNETSVYSREGGGLLLTHFCALTAAGHVARLAMQPREGAHGPLEFVYVGSSNLPAPGSPHMRRVLISFSDREHFTEQWTRVENGKDMVFELRFVRR